MNVRALLPKALFLFFASISVAQQRLTDDQANLVHLVAKQAAFAESSTSYCAQRDARNAARYTQAWQAWQQRNHWTELQSGAAASEMQQGEYDNLKAETQKKLAAQGSFRMAMVCSSLPQSLTTPQFDSSRAYGQQLAAIAGAGGSAAPPIAPPTAQPSAPPATAGAATSAPVPAPQQQAPAQAVAQSTPAAGPAASLDGVQYAQPAGWVAGRPVQGGATYGKPGKKMVIGVTVQPMRGDLMTSFRAAVHSTFPAPDLKLERIEHGKTPQGLEAVAVSDGGKLGGNNARYTSLRAAGIAMPDGHLLLLELMTTADSLDRIHAEDDFHALVRSVQMQGAPTAERWDVMHPPKGSGGLQGLYWATQLQNMINPMGGMDLRAERYYMLLLPNGQAYSELPTGGHVYDMDFAAAVAKHPRDCGTYSISNGVIHYIFPNEYGLLIETEGKVTQKSVSHDGRELFALKPVQGMRLSGKYSSTFAMVGNGITNTNSVSSTHTIVFSPDGRYQRTGSSGAAGSNFAISNRQGVTGGTYDISGYTLKLTPAGGGPPEISTIVFEDANPSPKAIWIDDNAYLQ